MSAPVLDYILFDFDGTLVDSVPDVCHGLNKALARIDRAPRTVEQVKSWVGKGARDLVVSALELSGGVLSDCETDAVCKDFLEAYAAEPIIDSVIFPGAVEMLETLQAQGKTLGICTNKPSLTAAPVMQALDLEKYFPVVLCGDQVIHKKPDARHVLDCVTAMGGTPERAVLVGDSENDAYAARNAGIAYVMVSFGYCHEPMDSLPMDVLIDHLSDLPDTIARMSRKLGAA
ncbi:phosphoglycolate phosphatase [Magnetospira sp. QH-2]|uniref:phosphoglycolate phosphatase n=1 Tax=Magnetospira sp. (strain QH-2) TaxID=1288970 RepID=UPI0003E81042|nr:phosphoglycolate phosphatase [Magnetospira sp. QH-2]CCQ75454.1 putative Phosphoglycolate phosphatase [Magnetospira sp. QH-2]